MEDEDIPPEILDRLWQVDEVDSTETIVMLKEYSLIIDGGPREGYVRLHDLQREFLQREGAAQVGRWHAEMLRRCGVPEIPAPSGPLFFRYWTGDRFLHHLSHAEFDGTDGAVGDLGDLASVAKLSLDQPRLSGNIRTLPDAIGRLRGLQVLSIFCPYLIQSPAAISRITSLVDLSFESCAHLEALPELGDLRSLQRLFVNNCHRLSRLPESIGGLRSLKELELRNCSALEPFPASIGQLTSLESFYLDRPIQLLPPEIFEMITSKLNLIPPPNVPFTLGMHFKRGNFSPGFKVVLSGIVSQPELNGMEGSILPGALGRRGSWEEERGRYKVALDGLDGRTILLEPGCLRLSDDMCLLPKWTAAWRADHGE